MFDHSRNIELVLRLYEEWSRESLRKSHIPEVSTYVNVSRKTQKSVGTYLFTLNNICNLKSVIFKWIELLH